MSKITTNNGKKGGWLVGKKHYDKNGKPLGGIKAIVTDAGGKPVELEGGEVIINAEASRKHWRELSRINQSAGNGVAIEPPSGFDYDPKDTYEDGGKIDFNPNHVPSKRIVNFAKTIKSKHPQIWKLGGNIFGNEAFVNLERASKRGYWLDSEKWMYIKWRAYVARHQRDYRIEGVVAMLKWCDTVEKGWGYMKDLIEEKIEKSKRGSKLKTDKMKDGGRTISQTPAPKAERIYGSETNKKNSASSKETAKNIKLDENVINSIKTIIEGTGIELATAKAVVRRGMGAYSSSHRPTITDGKPNSRVAWGLARLKAFVYKKEHGTSKSGKYNQDDDLMGQGGLIPEKGTLFTKDKKTKLDYKKVGDNYEFVISDGKPKKFDSITKIEYKKRANSKLVMNYNQFVNYLYSEGYTDDKMGHGGELALGIKAEHEHSKTIDKFKKHGVSDLEVETAIAKDHLKEDLHYYSKLKKMEENKFKSGGLTPYQKYKVHKVMSEFKNKELHSGSEKGNLVTDRKQAIAIALSEANASKYAEGGVLTNDQIESIINNPIVKDEVRVDWWGTEVGETTLKNKIYNVIEKNENLNIQDTRKIKPLVEEVFTEMLNREREKEYGYDLEHAKKIARVVNFDTELFNKKFGIKTMYIDPYYRLHIIFVSGDSIGLDLTSQYKRMEYFIKNKRSTFDREQDIKYWLMNASNSIDDNPNLILANLKSSNKQWSNHPKNYVPASEINVELKETSKLETYNILSYKNPYEVNRAIERLLDSKGDNREDYTSEEIEFMSYYSGYGGLEKQGKFEVSELKGLLYEYFTPDAVVQKMWGLAYKYGYGTVSDNSVFEPSTGIGAFIKYAPAGVRVAGNEINKYSAKICSILYPQAQITLQPFEKNFIKSNLSIKYDIENLPKYSLIIGNPPYGKLESKYIAMGEDKATFAQNWIEYFIVRGLDLLYKDGLLIYIVGAEQKNGGTLFLDSGMSKVKQMIFDKANLVDAYRLPVNIFERTGVSSEILVFKKR